MPKSRGLNSAKLDCKKMSFLTKKKNPTKDSFDLKVMSDSYMKC